MTRPYRLEVGRLAAGRSASSPPAPAGARATTLRLLGANLPDAAAARFDPPPTPPSATSRSRSPGCRTP